ncbi:MAG: hypothetical protein U0236_08500 [Nitrospira sp.]
MNAAWDVVLLDNLLVPLFLLHPIPAVTVRLLDLVQIEARCLSSSLRYRDILDNLAKHPENSA